MSSYRGRWMSTVGHVYLGVNLDPPELSPEFHMDVWDLGGADPFHFLDILFTSVYMKYHAQLFNTLVPPVNNESSAPSEKLIQTPSAFTSLCPLSHAPCWHGVYITNNRKPQHVNTYTQTHTQVCEQLGV
ncbi:Hypothetical predicted protein [Xyrichtys novacula]|uniref:Uncharacterized protein n=1 Tax=Xyrichtys novacula TaxID=13765 RepID=A0AAV1G9Q8_XYRNO|nr:Hypothetical predicted protein [Xyrichtys novacula]